MKNIILILTILTTLLTICSNSFAAIKEGQIISKFVSIVAFAETNVQFRSPINPTANVEELTLSPGECWVWDSDVVLFKDILILSDFAIMVAQGYSPMIVMEFLQDADN